MTPPEAEARLWHIHRSGEKLLRFISGKTFDDYSQDELLISAVERQLITVGEALRKALEVDPELKLSNIRRIIGFRNQLVHNYPSIDLRVVWGVLQQHLPLLLTEVRALLAESDAAP